MNRFFIIDRWENIVLDLRIHGLCGKHGSTCDSIVKDDHDTAARRFYGKAEEGCDFRRADHGERTDGILGEVADIGKLDREAASRRCLLEILLHDGGRHREC